MGMVERKICVVSTRTRTYQAQRTLRHLHALDGLVIHGAGALLDELVSLEADIEDLGALDGKLDELLHRRIDDVCRGLYHVTASESAHVAR